MARSVGKQFEADFAASIPKNVYCLRLKDPAQSFGGGNTRFSLPNPYDYILYNHPHFYALELKTASTTMTFWRKEYDTVKKQKTFNIKKHQIISLQKAAKYTGVVAGLILNFRSAECTYFLSINNFMKMTEKMTKRSINQVDVSSYGVLIPQRKLKVNYRYDIEYFMNEIKR